jgi:hypothetical protein
VIKARVETEAKKLYLKDNDDGNLEILSSDSKEAYKNQAKSLMNRYEDRLKSLISEQVNWKGRSNGNLAKCSTISVSR